MIQKNTNDSKDFQRRSFTECGKKAFRDVTFEDVEKLMVTDYAPPSIIPSGTTDHNIFTNLFPPAVQQGSWL